MTNLDFIRNIFGTLIIAVTVILVAIMNSPLEVYMILATIAAILGLGAFAVLVYAYYNIKN